MAKTTFPREFRVLLQGVDAKGANIAQSTYVNVTGAGVKEAREAALKLVAEGTIKCWHGGKSGMRPMTRAKATDAKQEPEPTIFANYFRGTDPKLVEPVFNRNKVSWTTAVRRDGPQADVGEWRMSYDTEGFLYSYEMPLCLKTKGPKGGEFFLVNGDGSPSMQTSKHQRALQDRLVKREWSGSGKTHKETRTVLHPHAFVPFSVLRAARISPGDIVVIDVTPDKVRLLKRMVKNRETAEMEEVVTRLHFLGETLFENKATGKLYVCGLDRNDNPNKRSFFLAELPVRDVTTVDAALASLRPSGLPKKAVRQGEWFFVPEPKYKAPKKGTEGVVVTSRVPIVDDKPETQLQAMVATEAPIIVGGVRRIRHGFVVRGRERRHVAGKMVINGAVYASGVVRDEEHDPLVLGDTWHRVVKNLAVSGWRYDSVGPSGRRARVD